MRTHRRILIISGTLVLCVLMATWSAQVATAQVCSGACPMQCDYELGSGQYPADYCRWPVTGCRAGDGSEDGGCCCPTSPLIIDEAGNGFSLTNAQGGIDFDLNNDGVKEHVAWTMGGSDDAWLVLDRNNDGNIDSGVEMFTNFAPQRRRPGRQPNGFLALAEFDDPMNGGNGDGVIDRADAIYPKLQLWRDADHDGVVDPGELTSLASNGILGIDLNYHKSRAVDEFGNAFRYRARLYTNDQQITHWIWDVYLVRD
jgi:hypothetical protein